MFLLKMCTAGRLEHKIMKDLPTTIKRKVQQENLSWLLKVPFFAALQEDADDKSSFVLDILERLQPRTYTPREYILRKG